jgi:hypothetical protein
LKYLSKMSLRSLIPSLLDELDKISAKVPVLHGTSGEWDVLRPNVGKTISPSDPNPKSLYVGTRNSMTEPHVSQMARQAVQDRGGTPVVARTKIDTRKGWVPHTLTAEGRKSMGSLEGARDTLDDIDRIAGRDKAARTARGEHWKKIQQGVGAWFHPEHTATLKPGRYTPAKARWSVLNAAKRGGKLRGYLPTSPHSPIFAK